MISVSNLIYRPSVLWLTLNFEYYHDICINKYIMCNNGTHSAVPWTVFYRRSNCTLFDFCHYQWHLFEQPTFCNAIFIFYFLSKHITQMSCLSDAQMMTYLCREKARANDSLMILSIVANHHRGHKMPIDLTRCSYQWIIYDSPYSMHNRCMKP